METDLTEAVIGASYEVANHLGTGFFEKVYERALLHELRLRGLRAEPQVPTPVFYKDQNVGDYLVDLLVEDSLVVELKCAETLANEHLAQTLNYLKASNRRLALLLNFKHAKLQIKRVVL